MSDSKDGIPSGFNLAKHSNENNETGSFALPLPFEGDNELIVEWEKIEDFEVSQDIADRWGYRLKKTKDGSHYLGRFLYNGEEMQPTTGSGDYGIEHFHECRFDVHGNDAWGSSEDFHESDAFNVTLMRRFLPKAGEFKAQTPSTEIMKIRFGSTGDYKLFWKTEGGPVWTLAVEDEAYIKGEDVQAVSWEKFVFNFFDNTVHYEHSFLPTDLWDDGGYE